MKVAAIALVASLHFFLNWGFYQQPYAGLAMALQAVVRWISLSCIGLFLMATGYLAAGKKATRRHYGAVQRYLVPYAAFCLLTAWALHGRVRLAQSFAYYLFRFPGYYWYMGLFLGLYFLIPYLNRLAGALRTRAEFGEFLGVLTGVVALPELWNALPPLLGSGERLFLLPSWWRDLFPLLYYFLGVFFRRFQPEHRSWRLLALVVLPPVTVSLFDLAASAGGAFRASGGGYGSLVTVTCSIGLFGLLYRLDTSSRLGRWVLAQLSDLTLEIYLALIVADRLTRTVLEHATPALLVRYEPRLYFVEVPLNLSIAIALAVGYRLVIGALAGCITALKSRVPSRAVARRP